jgi:hypothetical protein
MNLWILVIEFINFEQKFIMKYILVIVLLTASLSCGEKGLTKEDKEWIEKKIVQISDSIYKSSIANGNAPVDVPKELWNRVTLSLPDSYNLENAKPFEYSGAPEFDEDDPMTYGYNVGGFYPIGWSLNGLYFAYMSTGAGYGGSESIEILNTQTDEIESSLVLSESDPDGTKTYYQPQDKVVEDFIRKYEICKHFNYQKGDSFTSSKNGNKFTFEVAADEQIFFENAEMESGKVEIYANMISPKTKRKQISAYTSYGGVWSIEINGFIKSPVENKVILLVNNSERGYENETDIYYKLISCNLNVDAF